MALWLIICALTVVTLSESEKRELKIVSSYPKSENLSYIELICVYESVVLKSEVIEAQFQLNGTDIKEEIDEVKTLAGANNTIHFLLTQDKEGFFTCSLNESVSNNSIGLAGKTHRQMIT